MPVSLYACTIFWTPLRHRGFELDPSGLHVPSLPSDAVEDLVNSSCCIERTQIILQGKLHLSGVEPGLPGSPMFPGHLTLDNYRKGQKPAP